MRFLAIVLTAVLALPVPSRMAAQTPAPRLNLVILDGEGAVNNIKLRTAREPIVQVEDENHKPVAGAAVVFSLPSNGAGGSFATGQTFTTVTDSTGRAVGRGLKPNGIQGRYEIRVTASKDGQTASASIAMSNMVPAAAAGGAAVSGKLIAILAIAGAAVAGGVVAATRNGGNGGGSITTSTVTTITPGTGQVIPPR
jgi:hypothetical protein